MSLENGGPYTGHSERGTIECVDERGALLWPTLVVKWPIADVGAASLVVGEPADRGDLEPLPASGGVNLDIDAAVMALTEIAGADLDRSMVQAERRDHPLHPTDHLGEQHRCLLGRREGEDLDFVELVRPQHAAGVATGRTRLAPVTRRVSHESQRQFGLIEYLSSVDRGERHLSRRDAPQVVSFDGVGIIGELRQLTR